MNLDRQLSGADAGPPGPAGRRSGKAVAQDAVPSAGAAEFGAGPAGSRTRWAGSARQAATATTVKPTAHQNAVSNANAASAPLDAPAAAASRITASRAVPNAPPS